MGDVSSHKRKDECKLGDDHRLRPVSNVVLATALRSSLQCNLLARLTQLRLRMM